jgi:Putative zinc-finger
MNPLFQPDIHPDAESLNAFVERALPQPERAQILAHLGGCARCREVVFLAQAAAEGEAVPMARVQAESRPARSRWTSWKEKWQIALIPVATLATAAGLLIWVQMKSATPAPAVAQLSHQPPSPPPSFSVASAALVPPAAQAPAASAASSAAVQDVQRKAARAEQKISPSQDKKTLPAPPVATRNAAAGFGADANLLSMAPRAPLQESEITPALPSSAKAQWVAKARQAAVAQGDSAINAKVSSTDAIAAPPPPAPVSSNLTAVHGSLLTPANAGPRPLAAEAATSGQVELMPQPINGLSALRLTNHPRLPSGLNAVSSAVMLDRILAVDRDGAVFLSRDAAQHWERVPVQWTGKALAVQAPPRERYPSNAAAQKDAAPHTSPVASVSLMQEPPVPAPAALPSSNQSPAPSPAAGASSAPAPPPPPAEADAAPPVPGMLFKLINDRHQTWVSADGKVWHEQPGRE